MSQSPAELRRNYDSAILLEEDAGKDPFALFARWFEEAVGSGMLEPNAMTLATVSPEGQPSARLVLLKGFDSRGFTFFTNQASRKGRELANNPACALCFWWDVPHRQVRIEGRVGLVPNEEADAYFVSRPYGSRIGAWASAQSEVIDGRAGLEATERELRERYPTDVPRPPHWGGYRVVPFAFEFWQGRPDRLHDRLRYRRAQEGSWVRERLSP
jgi:pyridoxamine 5'-phosphate oxidase